MITSKGRRYLESGGNGAAIIDNDRELADMVRRVADAYSRRASSMGSPRVEVSVVDGDTVIRYQVERRVAYSPCTQTRTAYLAEVKAALFDIATGERTRDY